MDELDRYRRAVNAAVCKQCRTSTDGLCPQHRRQIALENMEAIQERPLGSGPLGWVCPVCGRGLAPTTEACGCVTRTSANGIDPTAQVIEYTPNLIASPAGTPTVTEPML